MAPTVTVVIPAYDRPEFLLEGLDSVFGQTFTDHEIVVVDDGSGPGLRRALEPILGRIRYVAQANAGQSSARNRGAREARGRYLAFLDDDDRWDPDYLTATVGFLNTHPDVGVVAPAVRMTDASGRPTPRVARKKSPGDRYTTRTLLQGDVGTIINPVVRRDAFFAAGGYDTSIHGPEDCDLWIRLSFITELAHLPVPLLLYRLHPGNASRDMLTNAEEWLRILDKLDREHPDFVAGNRGLVRRCRAKQYLRLGREHLRRGAEDREHTARARRALGRSIAHDPFRPRAYLYAALASWPGTGSLYARLRLKELAWRERLQTTRLVAWLTDRRYGKLSGRGPGP